MLGSLTMCGTYVLCILFHLLIPVRRHIKGYCCDQTTFRPLEYRLNGLLVLAAVFVLYVFALPISYVENLYTDYWNSLIGANVLGIGLSLAAYTIGGTEKYLRCLTTDQIMNGKPKPGTALAHKRPNELAVFYLGCKWNPRILGIDSKMMLYVLGAVGLMCNILSCAVAHIRFMGGSMSNAMLLYQAMFFWFICEYMYYEHVHIFTYDLFAEKLGFKLIWGCLVFYPYFYAIGCYSLVYSPAEKDLSVVTCGLIFSLFLVGWGITRGANLQKYEFRMNPKLDRFSFLFGLVVVPQKTLPSASLLISGWWGVARHFNYCGEIVQGFALAFPGLLVADNFYTLVSLLPLLYPLYYIVLFGTREIDDDAVCHTKYGDKWVEYCKTVPWRICPGVW